jgi:hypothetical protein
MTFIDEHKNNYPNGYFDSLEENANWIMDSSKDNLDALVDYIESLDKVRTTSFTETFPEYSEIINNARQ